MGPRACTSSEGSPRVVRALGLALVVVVVGYGASTLPGLRPESGYDPWLDGVLRGAGQLLAAVLATILARRRESWLWRALALSLWLRVAGTLVLVATITEADPVPGALTDLLWLAGSVTVVVALVLRIRERARSLTVLPVMDIVAGAAAVISASLSLLYVPLVDLAAQTGRVVTLLYLLQSAADTLVLVCVVALLASTGFRPTVSRGLLAAGLVALSLADVALRYRVGSGTYEAGTWIAGLSLAGMALVVAAFAVPDDPGPMLSRAPGLWLPVVYVLVATGVMVAAAYGDVPAAALPLAVTALLVEVLRGMRTITLQSRIADRRVSAAEIESWRFQRLAESSSDVVAMLSRHGAVDYLNPAGRRVAGVAASQLATLSVTDLLTEDGGAGWRELQEQLDRQGWVEAELELRGGAEPVPVVVSAFRLGQLDGEERFAVGVIMHDITVRRRAQVEAAGLAAERRELLRRLVLAQEDERTRVAADIHDDSIQVLASLHLRLTLLGERIEQRAPSLHEDVRQVVLTLDRAMDRLRHLMFDLDSPARRGALDTALEQAAGHVLGDSVTWRVHHEVDQPLSEEVRVTVYRIAVEALTNVRRHAAASRVELAVRLEDSDLVLDVVDDGLGAAAEALAPRPGHLGLAAMHDRARASGGTLQVHSTSGGTRVRLELPLDPAADAADDDSVPQPAS